MKALQINGLTYNNGNPLPPFGAFMEDQGGFFLGVVQIDGVLQGVVNAPKAEGELKGVYTEDYEDIDAKHLADGAHNTKAMAAAGSELAKKVLALAINGKTDWEIPARDVVELQYRHFKPGTDKNYCHFRDGENPSSIPPGFGYTKDLPAQTTITAFQSGGAEAFEEAWYLTSTQYSSFSAFFQDFGDGFQGYDDKHGEARVRAVRRFPIDQFAN